MIYKYYTITYCANGHEDFKVISAPGMAEAISTACDYPYIEFVTACDGPFETEREAAQFGKDKP